MGRLWAYSFFIMLLGSSAVAQEQKPFKLVALLPLTGALSEYGAAAKNGFELARSEHKESFKNLEIIYDDSKYDSKSALASFRRHGSGPDKANLFYAWGYGICQALIPIAEAEKVPVIAASAEKSVSAGKGYSLRFNYYHEQISAALWKYLRAKGFKRIALIKTELAYMNGILDGLRNLMKPDETLDLIDVFDMAEMDFKTTIAKLRAKKFDALGVFLTGGQGSRFFRQARQLGLNAPGFGTDFFDSDSVAEEAEGTMDGVVFATQEATPGFRERYRKAYGNDFQAVWAANSYEFAMLSARLFGDGGAEFPPEQVIKSFKAASLPTSGAARYRYNAAVEGPGFDFEVILREISDRKVVDLLP